MEYERAEITIVEFEEDEILTDEVESLLLQGYRNDYENRLV